MSKSKHKPMAHNPLDAAEHPIDLLLGDGGEEEPEEVPQPPEPVEVVDERQKVNYRLPKRLYLRLKVASALEETDMQEIVVDALEKELKRLERRRGGPYLPE